MGWRGRATSYPKLAKGGGGQLAGGCMRNPLHSGKISRGDPENDLKQLGGCCKAKEGHRLSCRKEVDATYLCHGILAPVFGFSSDFFYANLKRKIQKQAWKHLRIFVV